ncbi:MAG: amidophosphoribosyltransferase [Kiritimatiellae bacterium]|nr:amidophosphoribosyltransferase [Kiritimatiellia bacterium]
MKKIFHLKEKCGVFAAYNSPHAAQDIYLGLYAQQHRGQEGAGVIVSNGSSPHYTHKGTGLVTEVFSDEILQKLEGKHGIGHVRYSTSGHCGSNEIQPLVVTHQNTIIAIAHNGHITNAAKLKREMELNGSLFTSSSDTEVILHKIVHSKSKAPIQKIQDGLKTVEGAYSLVIKLGNAIAAVRDPHGFRPLHLGKRDDAWFFASETCAFDIIGAEYVCEIGPGEGYLISPRGLESFKLHITATPSFCAFELVYFSRPDSYHKSKSTHSYRLELGRALYEEHPIEADIVTAVPDSSNSAALGYASASGIPLDIGLIRNHYTGRTFIAPHQSTRESKVRQKFNVIGDAVENKRIVVVDDSIVRGTTCRKIISLFRENGAKEIHFRIASPMVSHPCYFGIDMPDREEFLVNKVPRNVLNSFLGVDSLGFLSGETLKRVVGENTCRACFTGDYPIHINHADERIEKAKETNHAPYAHL